MNMRASLGELGTMERRKTYHKSEVICEVVQKWGSVVTTVVISSKSKNVSVGQVLQFTQNRWQESCEIDTSMGNLELPAIKSEESGLNIKEDVQQISSGKVTPIPTMNREVESLKQYVPTPKLPEIFAEEVLLSIPESVFAYLKKAIGVTIYPGNFIISKRGIIKSTSLGLIRMYYIDRKKRDYIMKEFEIEFADTGLRLHL